MVVGRRPDDLTMLSSLLGTSSWKGGAGTTMGKARFLTQLPISQRGRLSRETIPWSQLYAQKQHCQQHRSHLQSTPLTGGRRRRQQPQPQHQYLHHQSFCCWPQLGPFYSSPSLSYTAPRPSSDLLLPGRNNSPSHVLKRYQHGSLLSTSDGAFLADDIPPTVVMSNDTMPSRTSNRVVPALPAEAESPESMAPDVDHTTMVTRDARLLTPESPTHMIRGGKSLLKDLELASSWNHGHQGFTKGEALWDPQFCQKTSDEYEAFLTHLVAAQNPGNTPDVSIIESPPEATGNSSTVLYLEEEIEQLLSPVTATLALKTLLKCNVPPNILSPRVRRWERCLGQLGRTPLTDHLSLRLVTANGKAGHVGRVLSLLQLRGQFRYRPRPREFLHAVTSLPAAQWALRRQGRNIFMPDRLQPLVDNPTRWLDAILINMHQRNFPLDITLANAMLQCFSAGYTGKAIHCFFRTKRQPVGAMPEDDQPSVTDDMPQNVFYLPEEGRKSLQPMKVKVKYNRGTPPFYKVPSQVRGKLLSFTKPSSSPLPAMAASDAHAAATADAQKQVIHLSRLEQEMDPRFSPPLSAAFSFAESLQQGACGHKPITLNTASYNALIKACVQRGALWRAMQVLDEVMPSHQCRPNHISYNLLLEGLARVGDTAMMEEYVNKMYYQSQLTPDAFTVRAVVGGLLNMGDIPSAITMVQDFFNQHSVLPPYTTHIKIFEVCLGQDMIHEAKRYLYFIQQLWRWKPNAYHTEQTIKLMQATQRNTQLQRPALEKLFAYFGEKLEDSDFL